MNSEVSRAALGRLPIYLKYLKSIDSKTISATKIAEELGFGEVQVRKDLAAVRDGRKSAMKPRRLSNDSKYV